MSENSKGEKGPGHKFSPVKQVQSNGTSTQTEAPESESLAPA